MFKLIEKYDVNKSILNCDYIKYSPSEISTIDTANSQIYINIPWDDSVVSWSNSYLELNLDVLHAATNNKYADINDTKLINLDPTVLFSIYKLTTSSGKHFEDISHRHFVSLIYKLITSGQDTIDVSIGFDWDRGRWQPKITRNEILKGKFFVRIMFKDIFGFAEHQGKATYGLDYKLTLTKTSDNSVLIKGIATNIGKIKIISIEWYVPHYTSSIPQQALLSKQILGKTPTYFNKQVG